MCGDKHNIMKTGIIVAMDKELQLLLPLLGSSMATITVNNFTFYNGAIAGHDVIVAKCGIGKVNAAIGALTMLETFHPSLIVNSGVAGGTGAGEKPLEILDILMPDEIAYHDVWCGPGTVPGQAAGCPARFACPLGNDVRHKLGARGGLLASGDIFVDKKEDIERILALYPDAMAVDMESAAIAQVCALKDVPFVCLRIISDTPGKDGNAAAYTNFWEDAPQRAFSAVEHLLALL